MEQHEPAAPRLPDGRYDLLEEVGRGAMGVVYRAFDRESRRPVALKALHGADPDDLYRLKSEFRALAGVVHPHLVRLYEMSVEGDRGFFTMELIEGGRTIVEHLRTLAAPWVALREAFRQLATALAALHAAGWVHRDLKPSNVLVDLNGRVVLLDFGLIRGLRSELAEPTQVGAVVGTLAYMSPEQALGRSLSPASDWYSFGVVLYECLTGRSPFEGASAMALLDRSRFTVPPAALVAPDIPADLATLVGALLATNPADRPDASHVLGVLGGSADLASAMPRRSTPFVGREREMAQLRAAWAALPGGATVATIEGSSGLGKSALLERFMAELPAQGALVLRARCYPHEIVPFEALDGVVDELSGYLSALPRDRLEALLPRDTAALRTVFPVLGRIALPPVRAPLASDTEPHELRRRGFEAIRELFGRLADRRPLVVWVDDLQWADADSTPLLREMLRAPDAPPVLWLFSFRAEDRDQSPMLHGLDKLFESLPPERRHALVLRPLSGEESAELLALLSEEPLARDAAASLASESRGSPFLLTELIGRRAAADSEPGARSVDVGEVVRRRLRGLPLEGRRLLESISVAAGPLERRIALEAAGVEALDPDLLVLLESSRLLRAAAGSGRRFEIYHDQIREAIHDALTPEDRGARHLGIADALERVGSKDAAALSMHHAGAGNRASAARYAVVAGDQAEQLLAFDQAARFYRSALTLERSAVHVARTLTRLGEALANAGRGAEAATAFEEAASEVPALEAEPLHQRAAEQFLVSGRIEEGKRVLAPLLAGHDVRYPKTSAGAVLAALLRLPSLARRYWLAGSEPGETSEPALALRVDACHTAAQGLLVVDPTRAAYFAVQSLVDVLRGGDAFRTGRALCVVGGALVPFGGLASAWALSMLERAERLAAELHDPRLDGMVAVSRAQAEFVAGRFGSMLALCDHGGRLLVEQCRGVRWDCDVANMAALRALEELGKIDELRRRVPRLIDEASSLDDRYAEVTFRLYDAYWMIASGRIDDARRTASETLVRWAGDGYQLQHFYEMRVQACCDVYQGAASQAWARLERAWRSLEGSGLMRHRMIQTDALLLRGRVALAAAGTTDARTLEREVLRCASALEGMKRPDASASADLLLAGLACRRGDQASSIARLVHAESSYAGAEMSLHVAYSMRRRGELADPRDGRALIEAADRILSGAGIHEPARWLAIQAPGFPAAAG